MIANIHPTKQTGNPFEGYLPFTEGTTCAVCATPLSGGPDTFGGFNLPLLCSVHYYESVAITPPLSALPALKDELQQLMSEKEEKEREISYLEDDLEDIEDSIDSVEAKIAAIENPPGMKPTVAVFIDGRLL